jgi:hypothetical protein
VTAANQPASDPIDGTGHGSSGFGWTARSSSVGSANSAHLIVSAAVAGASPATPGQASVAGLPTA